METNNKQPRRKADDGADSAYVQTSIYFLREVLEGVDELALEDERSRSSMINRILREAVEQRRRERAAA